MHNHSDIRIVVVDDEPTVAIVIAENLRNSNYIAYDVSSGREALALFAKEPVDIMITDLVMPEISGLELAKRIINQYPDTIIIGISAYDDMQGVIEFMRLGCHDFLQKPFNYSDLNKSISNAIHRLELKKQLEWTQHELIHKNQALEFEIEEREKINRSLEMSQKNLTSIFDAMNDLVFILDSNGCLLYVNRVVSLQLGYRKDVLIGMNILEIHAPQHLKDVATFVADMLEGKDTLFIGHLMRKDGSHIDVETKITKGIWNEKEALIAVSRNVSDYKQAQRDMKIAQAESKAKSEFLANVSHDLRTPLNGILGYTQVLIREKSIQDKYKEQIQIIHKCGEHLLLLINDILDLSKIEAGKLELQISDFYLDDFLKRIVDICQIFARKKKIKLNFSVSSDCPKCVKGDEKRLRQVLLNLLNNAIKFTFQGQVNFDVIMHDQKIRLSVTDTGVGIPENMTQKVFEAFHQLDNQSRQTEGTGLGLAISQKIVQMMGGHIYLESKINKGSKFWFDIHLPEVFNQERESTRHRWSYVNGHGLRVLIVDDNNLNRKFFSQMLQLNKFEIYEAEDGYQAVEQTEKCRPHLIIMDLMMPKMSGIDAIKEIRKKPENQNMVIFSISANTEFANICNENSGLSDYFFKKPIDMDEFYNQVQQKLNITATKTISDTDDENTESESENIIIPDPKSLIQLYQMAKTGNVLRLEKMSNQLEKQNNAWKAFAQKIRDMAKGFQINELKNFLEELLK